MNKLNLWLRRFMTGRNGWDALNQALLTLYVALWISSLLVAAVLGPGLFSGLFTLCMNASLLVMLFRLLSRNLPKRQGENLWWLNSPLLSGLRRFRRNVSGFFFRLRDREHRYFKCRHCGTYCRVPAGKGRLLITCPRCGRELQGRS